MQLNQMIKNGTTVTVGESNLKATVIGICIRGINQVTIEYQVQWVDGSGIHDFWVYSYMVKEFVDTRQPAGMVNYNKEIIKT